MKNYQAYLFDWDGTLVKTMEMWVLAVQQQLRRHGVRLTDVEVAHKFVGRLNEGSKEIGLNDTEQEEFINGVIDKGKEYMTDTTLYPGVYDMLMSLKKSGKKIGLITSTFKDILGNMLEAHNMVEMFDVTVTAEDVRQTKPDPEAILLALERMGNDIDEAVLVGDSEKDLGAANNAGVDSILFFPKSHELFYDKNYLNSFGPKYTLTNWKDLK